MQATSRWFKDNCPITQKICFDYIGIQIKQKFMSLFPQAYGSNNYYVDNNKWFRKTFLRFNKNLWPK